jgi:hypothetical protein
MRADIENPMVIDSLWKYREQEPEIIGTCEGCGDDILEGEDIYDFDGGLVHQDSDCCLQYVANMSRCRVAGE